MTKLSLITALAALALAGTVEASQAASNNKARTVRSTTISTSSQNRAITIVRTPNQLPPNPCKTACRR